MTNEKIGHVAGEYVKFIRGHVGFLKQRSAITDDMWFWEDRGYMTLCMICISPPQTKAGYCRVILNGKTVRAHRAMYEQEIGPIPRGMQIDHLCNQTDCINPDHLEPVTPLVNTQRSRATKLSEEDIAEIRVSSLSGNDLAEKFRVSRKYIYAVRSRRVRS